MLLLYSRCVCINKNPNPKDLSVENLLNLRGEGNWRSDDQAELLPVLGTAGPIGV